MWIGRSVGKIWKRLEEATAKDELAGRFKLQRKPLRIRSSHRDAIEIIPFRPNRGAFGRFHAFLSIQNFLRSGIVSGDNTLRAHYASNLR